MKKLGITLAVLSALVISQPAKATFADAVKAFEAGSYQIAFDEFKLLSEMGNKQAQFNLGFMYVDGSGIPQDLVKGYAWIKLSDEGRDKPSEILANIEPHLSIEKKQQADLLYQSLFSEYSSETMVAKLKPIFKVIEKKEKKKTAKVIKQVAPKYPDRANIAGITGHITMSISLDEDGTPAKIDVVESSPEGVFDKSARIAVNQWLFDVEGVDISKPLTYKLEFTFAGTEWVPGRYIKFSKEELQEHKEKSANGDAISQYIYAKYTKDSINPSEWYYKSASQGVVEAQFELGKNLMKGKGCEVDKEKGLQWFLRSAAGNYAKSQLQLAKYYKTLNDDENYNYWLRTALERQDPVESFELAKFLDENLLDEKESVRLAGFGINDIWKQLTILKENYDPYDLHYYELYAKTAFKVGKFEEAVQYQRKANKLVKSWYRVPGPMKDRLEQYKDALEDSQEYN